VDALATLDATAAPSAIAFLIVSPFVCAPFWLVRSLSTALTLHENKSPEQRKASLI
jgi:hypothetical protein